MNQTTTDNNPSSITTTAAVTWNDYYANMKELEGFESQANSKKRLIIQNIRDCVEKLVLTGAISIKQDQIAIYVWNKLLEKGIKYTKSHFYSEFTPEQKRNYTQSSQGNNHHHSHKWKIITDNKNGRWENCDCGANRINDIEQVTYYEDSNEEKQKPLFEIVYPDGPEFKLLDLYEEISQNNIRIIKMIRKKTSINKTVMTKQIGKKNSEDEKEKRQNDIERLVHQRIKVLKDDINLIDKPKTLLKKANAIIVNQLYAMKYFDDRSSLLYWQKLMARLAVYIGYDQNTIARTVNISSKHMKLNIMDMLPGSDQLLHDIEWFDRCPNPDCGIILKDYFESKISDFRTGKKLDEIEDYELEPLILTGYQKQNSELRQKIRELKKYNATTTTAAASSSSSSAASASH